MPKAPRITGRCRVDDLRQMHPPLDTSPQTADNARDGRAGRFDDTRQI